jgi:hypothetical protein
MASIQVAWELSIPDTEEAGAGESPLSDETTLQFVFITAFDGIVRTNSYTTPNVFPDGLGAGVIGELDPTTEDRPNSKNAPTCRNPFFGVAVWAIKHDSTGSARTEDIDWFHRAVRDGCQDILWDDEIPTIATLWAANTPRRPNNCGGDDDFVGAAMQMFPTYGSDNRSSLNNEANYSDGHILPNSAMSFDLALQQPANTDYRLQCEVRLVVNNPTGSLLVGELLAA